MELTQIRTAKHGTGIRVSNDVAQAGSQPLQSQPLRPRRDVPQPFDSEWIQRGESGFGQGEQAVIHFIEEVSDGRTEGGC